MEEEGDQGYRSIVSFRYEETAIVDKGGSTILAEYKVWDFSLGYRYGGNGDLGAITELVRNPRALSVPLSFVRATGQIPSTDMDIRFPGRTYNKKVDIKLSGPSNPVVVPLSLSAGSLYSLDIKQAHRDNV